MRINHPYQLFKNSPNKEASPDEYVSDVQFLCSDASAYMNGKNIVIDGGRSVL